MLLLPSATTATAASQKGLSRSATPAVHHTAPASAKTKRLRVKTLYWRRVASAYADKLGFTLHWKPLSNVLSKLKAQHKGARAGARYWYHRYRRIRALNIKTEHLRAKAQLRARRVHPHRHIELTWKSLSMNPDIAKKRHHKAVRIAEHWLNELRSIAHPTVTQVVYMILSYPDWRYADPVEKARCESGLSWSAANPRSTARGIFQLLDTIREHFHAGDGFNAGLNIRAAYEYWQMAGWSPWYASIGCWGPT